MDENILMLLLLLMIELLLRTGFLLSDFTAVACLAFYYSFLFGQWLTVVLIIGFYWSDSGGLTRICSGEMTESVAVCKKDGWIAV